MTHKLIIRQSKHGPTQVDTKINSESWDWSTTRARARGREAFVERQSGIVKHGVMCSVLLVPVISCITKFLIKYSTLGRAWYQSRQLDIQTFMQQVSQCDSEGERNGCTSGMCCKLLDGDESHMNPKVQIWVTRHTNISWLVYLGLVQGSFVIVTVFSPRIQTQCVTTVSVLSTLSCKMFRDS